MSKLEQTNKLYLSSIVLITGLFIFQTIMMVFTLSEYDAELKNFEERLWRVEQTQDSVTTILRQLTDYLGDDKWRSEDLLCKDYALVKGWKFKGVYLAPRYNTRITRAGLLIECIFRQEKEDTFEMHYVNVDKIEREARSSEYKFILCKLEKRLNCKKYLGH